MAYSDINGEVTKVIDSREKFTGVAWDSVNKQLYYSSPYAIYRSEIDGTNVQMVLNTTDCKLFHADAAHAVCFVTKIHKF